MPIDNNRHAEMARTQIMISTEHVEERLRTEFWRDATRPIYDITPIPGMENQPLEGT